MLVGTTVSGPARAQPSDAQVTASARLLFQEGLDLGDEGRWQDAADRFRRSLELRPSPVVAYNLSSALVQLGGLVEASELLRGIDRDPDAQRNVREVSQALLQQITPRIALLKIELMGDPSSAEVRVDDRLFTQAMIGVEIPSDPGNHLIAIVRDGEEIASRQVLLAEGSLEVVSFDLPQAPAPTPREVAEQTQAPIAPARAPLDEEDDSTVFSSGWFWIGLAVVAAAATVGGYLLFSDSSSTPDPVLGNFGPMIIEVGE